MTALLPLCLGILHWVGAAGVAQAAAAPADPASSGVVLDRVAAVVNDHVITLTEVYQFREYIEQKAADPAARLAAEQEVVERLVERVLVQDEVARLKIDITDAEVESQIDAIASQNNLDREALRVEIEKTGMTWDAYRTEIKQGLRDQNFGQYVLRPRINITEDEIKDAWRRANPGATDSVRLQGLFLAWPAGGDEVAREGVRARAQDLAQQARTGADFAALSRANDEGPFGAQGGEMGWLNPAQVMPALQAAVAAAGVGAVTPPVETDRGMWLLRVVDRGIDDQRFAAAKEDLMSQVFQQRLVDEQVRWFEQARRQASVRVLLAAQPTAPAASPSPAAPAEPSPSPAAPAPPEPSPGPAAPASPEPSPSPAPG